MADVSELGVVLSADVDNPDVGDLALDATGNAVGKTSLAECVQQRLTVRLNFFRGEWFLDLDAGTPYFEYILVKAPQDRLIRMVFAQVIGGCEGVAQLTRLSYSISRDRRMTLSFDAQLADGSTFRSVEYPPFVVTL
jgi:hypothetical protein